MTSDATTPPAAEPPAYDPWSAMPPAVAPPTEQFPVIAAPDAPVTPAPLSAPPAPVSAPPPTAQFPAAPQFSAPPAQYSAPPAQFSAPPVPAAGVVAPYHGPAPAAYPPAGPVPPTQSAVAVQIAEIVVTPPVIRTPVGVLPLAGASWYVTDYWQKEEKIAPWAVVAAILGFFCLTVFSLLFLLIKETRHYGTVQVTVSSGGHQYVARIPVTDQFQVQQLNNQVNYARSLSAG
ncbi:MULTISPECIES: hypothetical protein [unclassified Micromonospora]|uniref:hypothetical protein n=1 Tax=unclassified Micromonospora TaxID=2617518 RepID=UPI0022B6744E|nr:MULTISPECIES: hypothetical protein [unclassified Micromonospora]MCZ7477119.1 hypothetical protein [Micromonospora sp. WMMC273]WBC01910.1 hypothetical protein O7546_22605 [Micromonospora sp. WMMA1976]